ncbi:Putative lumazine-binding protein [Salinivirga cyanobacteriivorans]|uniref:Lumazine-binding protein n=1 Tax=Salinivirga cyanobacteriivorans TaxID=1307839 RepID=A0A0S2HYK0_9BACT|nr:nuclear transport factor 2 family protein [Salinivirga cyanobacteriivorans]ALO15151.1 Putative lumazine-binding protein [Salinivirga cyanobacteriivorans]
MYYIRIAITLMALTFAVSASMGQKDRLMIQKVIEEGYVQGLHNKGDLQKTAASFHPGFNLLGVRNNMLTKFPIYSWLESSKQRREKSEDKRTSRTIAKYPMIDITGNAAIAKVELYKDDKKIFTDYLSLYRFNEGWRIVSKIYHDHR